MKKQTLFISILFLVLTLTGSLKIAGTIGYYALFTEDFVERFCENKESPELNCDGKCQLAKMLMEESNEEDLPLNIEFLKIETVLFYETESSIEFKSFLIENNTINTYTNLYYFNFLEKELQPPKV